MQKGAIAQPIPIGQPTALVASDLERLRDTRYVASSPQKLRDSHHMIARLAATGLRPNKIAEQTGYSYQRVRDLLDSPAMQELVAKYRLRVDESFIENTDEFFSAATSNMLIAERMIADTLAEADASGELPSLRTLDAISQGRADRFGYPKKTHQTNVNIDFAAQLEKAIARSGKTIEGTSRAVLSSPQSASATPRSAESYPAPQSATRPPPIRRRA